LYILGAGYTYKLFNHPVS